MLWTLRSCLSNPRPTGLIISHGYFFRKGRTRCHRVLLVFFSGVFGQKSVFLKLVQSLSWVWRRNYGFFLESFAWLHVPSAAFLLRVRTLQAKDEEIAQVETTFAALLGSSRNSTTRESKMWRMWIWIHIPHPQDPHSLPYLPLPPEDDPCTVLPQMGPGQGKRFVHAQRTVVSPKSRVVLPPRAGLKKWSIAIDSKSSQLYD